MTLIDLYRRLKSLDLSVSSLMKEAGYDYNGWTGEGVCPDVCDPDEALLLNTASEMLYGFLRFHQMLHYLSLPTHGIYKLTQMSGERYGYYDSNGISHILTCGQPLEALIPGENGFMSEWVCSRLEHNGEDYYLFGYSSISLSNLTIRERW